MFPRRSSERQDCNYVNRYDTEPSRNPRSSRRRSRSRSPGAQTWPRNVRPRRDDYDDRWSSSRHHHQEEAAGSERLTRSRSRSRPRYHRCHGAGRRGSGFSGGSRSRSRPRHVVPTERRDQEYSPGPRTHSQVHPSPARQTPQADDEWNGTNEPLPTSETDPFLCETIQFCIRHGVGSNGDSRSLSANSFSVSLDTAKCPRIFQYHVTVVPGEGASADSGGTPRLIGGRRIMRPLLRRVVQDTIQQYANAFGGIPVAYDGANALFAPSALPLSVDGEVFRVSSTARNCYAMKPRGVLEGVVRRFTVHIKSVKEIDLALLREAFTDSTAEVKRLIYALDTVLKAGVAASLIDFHGNFYSQMNSVSLRGGKVLHEGHRQALYLGGGTLVLNIDQVWREFYAHGSLLEVVDEVYNTLVSGLHDARVLQQELSHVMVYVDHRTTNLKQVVGVSSSPLRSTMICVDDTTLSVEEYFLKRYNVRLRYPHLPPVNLGGRRPGTESWVPVELCNVAPGQPYCGVNRVNTATIRKHTVVRPHDRQVNIRRLRNRLNFDNDPFFKAFGLSVAGIMEAVGVRVLDPHTRTHHSNQRMGHGIWLITRSCGHPHCLIGASWFAPIQTVLIRVYQFEKLKISSVNSVRRL